MSFFLVIPLNHKNETKKHSIGLLLPHAGQLKGAQNIPLDCRSTFILMACAHVLTYLHTQINTNTKTEKQERVRMKSNP